MNYLTIEQLLTKCENSVGVKNIRAEFISKNTFTFIAFNLGYSIPLHSTLDEVEYYLSHSIECLGALA